MEFYQNGIDIGGGPYIMVPIGINPNQHHINFKYSFIYLYDIPTERNFIVNISHNDFPISNYENFIEQLKGKAIFLYGKAAPYEIDNYVNVELIKWLLDNESYEFNYPQSIFRYHGWYSDHDECNNFIPIVLWYQYLENIKDAFLIDYNRMRENSWLKEPIKFYTKLQDTFGKIEYTGMQVDVNHSMLPYHYNGKLHSYFNYYTLTGRPSNRFGGFNFAALDKENGERSIIIPRSKDGFLIEFDYETYHIRLIAKILGYELPKESVHTYFGRKYFNQDVLSDDEYEESKKISFRLLYGKELEDFHDLEFFGDVYEFREKLWEQFTEYGYINMPLSNRRIIKGNFQNMTESKLFNYFIQGYETEVNSLMLREINEYLLNKETELVLYTYDSLLFDYNPNDGKQVIIDIKEIMEGDDYPTSIKYGFNYHKMKKYEK